MSQPLKNRKIQFLVHWLTVKLYFTNNVRTINALVLFSLSAILVLCFEWKMCLSLEVCKKKKDINKKIGDQNHVQDSIASQRLGIIT